MCSTCFWVYWLVRHDLKSVLYLHTKIPRLTAGAIREGEYFNSKASFTNSKVSFTEKLKGTIKWRESLKMS